MGHGFFAFLNVYSIQAVLPMVMDDFHASALQAGMTVGATALAVGLVTGGAFIGFAAMMATVRIELTLNQYKGNFDLQMEQ